MQSITIASQDTLVDSLSFKWPGTGSYVSERENVTYHPEGSCSDSATSGTTVVNFRLSSDGWLDPSTFRIMFSIVNDDPNGGAKKLRALGDVCAFFRRMRISIRGIIVEHIDQYNRLSQMCSLFQSEGSCKHEKCEGFRYNDSIENMDTDNELGGIAASQTVMFKPLSGFFSQAKFLPLAYCPIEIELELVSDVNEPIVSLATTAFTAANTSYRRKLENLMHTTDVVVLDSAMDNKGTEHLAAGKTIPIVCDTYISSLQTIVSADTQINVSRS
jgi:hypothetical protein